MNANVWTFYSDAFAAPSEYGWVYNYQTLITGFIALATAAIIIYTTRLQIRSERDRADREKAERANAARMTLVNQFEDLIGQLDSIEWDIETWVHADNPYQPLRAHAQLPEIALGPEFTYLPPSDAEAVLVFAHDIKRVNEMLRVTRDTQGGDHAALEAQTHAADKLLKLLAWRDRLAADLNWEAMRFPADRLEKLESIVADAQASEEVAKSG